MMETTIDLKKKIHEFIDQADERILKIISAIINVEKNDEEAQTVPDSFYEQLNKRRERHLKGESKSYTWDEVKTRARAALK